MNAMMRHLRRLLVVSGLLGMLGVLPQALAQTTEAPKPTADRTLKGDAMCTRCHDESEPKPIMALYQSRHGVKGDARTPGCQSCHGASEKHRAGDPTQKEQRPRPDVVFGTKSKPYQASLPDEQAAVCLTCHQAGKRLHWEGSQHQSREVSCTNCHTNHHKTGDPVLKRTTQREVCFKCHQTERAESMRVSTHPIAAGKVTCSDCHNPHGSAGPKLMADISVRDTCYTCHAEKRGPFLWEHPSAMDDCTNCHSPHGSTNTPLLKARAPWLCLSCHGDAPSPHPGNVYSGASLPGGTVANVNTQNPVLNGPSGINPVTGKGVALNNPPPQVAFRGCVNCHQQIHGSNAPDGKRFIR